MTKHYNKTTEKIKRKSLRNNATEAERKLWQHLKGKQVEGVRFRRQYSVDSYVVDFYAPACKLGTEIDGDSHFLPEAIEYDRERTNYISHFGTKILRFNNYDIFHNLEGVLLRIKKIILQMKKTPNLP